MEVILLEDVEKLGKKYQRVKVRDGYGRNYLIPRKLAVIANESHVKHIAEISRQQQRKVEKLLKDMRELADKLNKTVFKIIAKVGKDGKLFGSVTSADLAEAIRTQAGIDIDRKTITFTEDIKSTGTYRAKVQLHTEVEAELSFEVSEK